MTTVESQESLRSRVKIEQIPITHEDQRRAITEFYDSNEPTFANQKIMRIYEITDERGVRLGNHIGSFFILPREKSMSLSFKTRTPVKDGRRLSFPQVQKFCFPQMLLTF